MLFLTIYQNQTSQVKETTGKYPLWILRYTQNSTTKILSNSIQQHIKIVLRHDHMEFILEMQGLFNIWQSEFYTILIDKG